MPSACDEIYAPVCGCDDTTYNSECSANREGVSVAHVGACDKGCMDRGVYFPDGASFPDDEGCNTCWCRGGKFACTAKGCTRTICGARAGDTCKDDEYCAYITGTGQFCGAADVSSYCKARPTACTKELVYVCGCNGMTYANACEAARAGTGVLSNGACAP